MAEALLYTSEEVIPWRTGKMAAMVLYSSEQPIEVERVRAIVLSKAYAFLFPTSKSHL
jgi:hypothetical protein